MKSVCAIDVACNDPDNGIFAGRTAMIMFGDNELEAQLPQGFKFTELENGFRIHRQVFETAASKDWVGNWCWNRYFLRRDEMKRLLRTLKVHGWRCTCGRSAIYRWFNDE